MRLLKQSTARDIVVFMTDSTDHVTGKTGLTLTITASKAGAAFASITPTVTELATGWYKLALTSSHTDTLGDLALHITATGADPTDTQMQVLALLPGDAVSLDSTSRATLVDEIWDEVLSGASHNVVNSAGRRLRQVDASFVITTGTAQAGTSSSITLASGESATNDIYKHDGLIIVGGTGIGESAIITAYNGTTKVATVAPTFVITPDATSEYEIVPAIACVHSIGDNVITAASTALDFVTEVQSGLASQASVNTIDDFLDTEIAAIKAKTDNLPATPAATGDAMTLTSAYDFAKGTVAMTEGYATDGAAATPSQMLYMLWALMSEKTVTSTTLTAKKLDGSTTAMTFTLNDASAPTSITRAS